MCLEWSLAWKLSPHLARQSQTVGLLQKEAELWLSEEEEINREVGVVEEEKR